MKLIFLFALLGIIVTSNIEIGSSESIIGNNPAPLIPWMVSLQRNGRHFCGAQIVNPTTILTAAHCVQGVSASQIAARLGITNLNAAGGETLNISRIISHPQFSYDILANDIAVIKLSTPSRNIQFAQLDTTGIAKPGLQVVSYGWRNTPNGGPTSSILLQHNLTVKDAKECKSYLDIYSDEWSICCRGQSDLDTPCSGDSGGPIVANGNILVGTVSYGKFCRSYSAFARISHLKDFIQQYL